LAKVNIPLPNERPRSFEDKNWLKEGLLVPTKKIKKENCVRGIILPSPRRRRGCV
jgi:hypothetical protein